MKMLYLIGVSKALSCFLLMLLAVFNVSAGKYDVSNIPEHLKENAIAVIREHSITFEVSNSTRARKKERMVITILERRAEGLADMKVFYDSSDRLRSYSATIYDANGKKVRDLKKNEFIDQSANPSFSLYGDGRVLYTDIYRSQLPFTVEYEFDLEHRDGYFFHSWIPQRIPELSLENASFTLDVPPGMNFRQRVINSDELQADVTKTSSKTSFKWTLAGLPAVKDEPYMPAITSIVPYVLLGSEDFSYGGTKGSMGTWEDYGKWIWNLNKERQQLPQATREKVQELIAGVDDTREKVRAIYEYMQSRTRYVSISLGIGGFQPFDAMTVDRTGYGDCKALSNYTMALLQEAGIGSLYTLIYSNDIPSNIREDFPAKVFNHAILCVPLENDTLWLECTNNQIPMGHIGSSNAERKVLLITPDGGKLVSTPRYEHDENKQVRTTNATLLANGNIEFSNSTIYQGIRIEDRLGLSLQGPASQKRYLQQNLGLNNPEIVEIAYEKSWHNNLHLAENIQVKTNQYVSRAGNRILFQPNILSRFASPPAIMDNRIHKVLLRRSALYADTVFWELPGGYSVTHLPEEVLVDNEFGFFNCSYEIGDNKLIYKRIFYTKHHLHQPEKYQDFVEFFRTVHNADRAQVIISKE